MKGEILSLSDEPSDRREESERRDEIRRRTDRDRARLVDGSGKTTPWVPLIMLLITLLVGIAVYNFQELKTDYRDHKSHSDEAHRQTLLALQAIVNQQAQTCRVTIAIAKKQRVDVDALDCTPPPSNGGTR